VVQAVPAGAGQAVGVGFVVLLEAVDLGPGDTEPDVAVDALCSSSASLRKIVRFSRRRTALFRTPPPRARVAPRRLTGNVARRTVALTVPGWD